MRSLPGQKLDLPNSVRALIISHATLSGSERRDLSGPLGAEWESLTLRSREALCVQGEDQLPLLLPPAAWDLRDVRPF